MKAFSELLQQLYFTSSNNEKSRLLRHYLKTTPDPDRGWAIAALAGTLKFEFFKRNAVKTLMLERVDPELFAMSYDYVGEMSETVAHLWPDASAPVELPSLTTLIHQFNQAKRDEVKVLLNHYLSGMTAEQRWSLLKLGTRGLRVGLSARSVKRILADYGNKEVSEIETLWHALEPPYTSLFDWLEGRADKPDITGAVTFHPVMLSHPLPEDAISRLSAADWQVEYKYDGIRVQWVCTEQGKALYSRTGDDISDAFADVLTATDIQGVIDGELLIINNGQIDTFNALQQRLNRKKPSAKLMRERPAGLVVYDILHDGNKDVTALSLQERRNILQQWLSAADNHKLILSPVLPVHNLDELQLAYKAASADQGVEGLMLKRKDSLYQPGRPVGQWYKWKREARHLDAVIMYAQRGHGKRSSYYSDFTFGVWQGDTLLPIGKAYSGFTDEELKKLDNWVRRNATGRFGPVREVQKTLVVEVAFDAIHPSSRHKSGVALRFPRIHRIRWDKPASEADTLENARRLIIET
ncbi:cisplatin damage response ATP-dependent DNA ligase [Alteromonas lipolytica]|uniref:DNA ligase (ATP) n=1 Tax=Alteromonas lipolytica TaxID=1856405 RepID=A0A1E8F8Y3_9ALTE|nr:cisplatin damage response ATP-dependent DNA ligase [Alteromonas lipolytica]OFI32374.1 ATP-dependent DNA ligase [Alteromonas lipolytica]GGF86546.1 ATP-dependent DNA ligase [Alteromonas lipolytica]